MKFFIKHPHQIFTILTLIALIVVLTACGGKKKDDAAADAPPPTNTSPAQTTTDTGAANASSETEMIKEGLMRLTSSEDGKALEIWVDDVEDLAGIDLQLQFDPAQMQVVDADTEKEGVQLMTGTAPSPDFVAENLVDNQTGLVRYAAVRIPPSDSFSGSGVVAIINWEGEFNLDSVSLGEVKLADSDGHEIQR